MAEEKFTETEFGFPEDINEQREDSLGEQFLNNEFKYEEQDIRIEDIIGFIDTVTSIPSKTPRRLREQVKIYVDDVTTPTTKRLYIYSNKTKSWNYVTLT